ncbi:hypothetical protein ACJ41O_001339 [Fusarium nematophilum]
MKFLALITAAFALNVPALAVPVEANTVSLEARDPFVFCKPKLNGKEKSFKVDVAVAQAQARKAGLTTGKSGDPHRYFNGDKLVFGVNNCDKASAILWEYPIYWVEKKGVEWEKDVKTDKQRGGSTPIRVVYSNSNGGIEYCGVMTHSTVNANNQGSAFFQKCT